jgi:hypothetical protein
MAQAKRQLFFHRGKNDLLIWILKQHAYRVLAMWPHHLTHLWLIQPADEAKQAAFARAVVTDQTDARLDELQG